MNIKRYFFVLLLGLSGQIANAAELKNLYEVRTKVASQSVSERNKGFTAALEEVLLRVSGDADVLENDQIQRLFISPARFVKEYRYEQDRNSQNNSSQNGSVIELFTLFNQTALQKSLFDSGVRVWPENRPNVLIWLAVKEKGRSYVMHKSRSRSIAASVARAAKRRALPVIWPLKSDITLGSVSVTDIQGGFHENVFELSDNYTSSAVAIVTLEQETNASWRLSGKLVVGNDEISLEPKVGGRDRVINNGINFITNRLADNYAVSNFDETSEYIQVRVKGIEQLSDYAQARQYIADMVVVETLIEDSFNGKSVDFTLNLRSDRTSFERILALDKVMKLVDTIEIYPVDVAPINLSTDEQNATGINTSASEQETPENIGTDKSENVSTEPDVEPQNSSEQVLSELTVNGLSQPGLPMPERALEKSELNQEQRKPEKTILVLELI